MALKFYDSPFHVNHDEETASKMVMKMDLSIMLSRLIESKQWTQAQAAEQLGVKQSRISDLVNAKIEKFTIDALFDMLDKLGFQVSWTMSSLQKATVNIDATKARLPFILNSITPAPILPRWVIDDFGASPIWIRLKSLPNSS